MHFDQWRFIREESSWGNPPIVFDLSFLREMPTKEANSIAMREIPHAIANLKRSNGPLPPVYLTSFDPKCDACQSIIDFFNIRTKRGISDFYLNITEKSYLVRQCLSSPMALFGCGYIRTMLEPFLFLFLQDLFPPQNLIYLSPDSRTDLTEYRDDDVMILGALIGKETSGHTLTRAKQAGIRHARLPMRKVLGFTSALNIDACLPILNDFRNTRDWFYSFRWIPPR